MPFPAGLTLVTVHCQFDTLPNGGASGTVQFTAPEPLVGAADNSIVPPPTATGVLDASGSCTVQLPATNDPQWTPVDWAYNVLANVTGGPIRGTLQLDYQTTAVELADLLQVDGAAETGTTYIPLSQRSTAGGVAGLDADGDVIDASGSKVGEAAGGGISETIVNAKGDLIAATAADTVARLPVGTDGQYLKAASGQATGLQWDTFTAADISDSTATGRAVVTATDAAAGRTAIGAEASGAASSAVAAHVAAADPHTQYAQESALGGAAVLNVGTSAGTVAAGDDSRITGALQRSTLTTKGDLYVATASATVARLGVGSNGQVLTADSGEATGAKWATPSGGGGSTLVVKRAIVTSGNITPQNTGGSWAVLTGGPTLTIAAAVGDYLAVEIMGALNQSNAATFLDLAVIVGGSPVRYGSNGTGTPSAEGAAEFYPDVTFKYYGGGFDFVAESGDLSGGNVTVGFAVKSTGSGTLFANAYPFRWRIINYGAVTVS